MKKSSFKFDMAKLNELKKNLGARPDIQVGVFSARSTRKDGKLTNADLARAHELGVPEHNLPARSMLKVPISDHAQEIMAPFKGHADAYVKGGGTLENMWKQIGAACEAVVAQGFKTQGFGKWAPLSPRYYMWKVTHNTSGKRRSKRKISDILGRIYAGQESIAILILTGEFRRSFSSRVRMRFT